MNTNLPQSKPLFEQVANILQVDPKRIHSESDFAKPIQQGLRFKIVENVATELGLSKHDLSHIFGITERTLTRRKNEDRLQALESDRFYRLVKIYALAIHVLENKKMAIHWLSTPKTTLGGVIPLSLLDTEAGSREVEQQLWRIEYSILS